ncbi:uncharacterized protein LOC112554335 [Pomacea canaliculata]|uniref:uncharacterized protein LOC112554335 n=1 Tax=Pomacea canaliculata TaxID=400727 RepID=UPI000D736D4C|nr:uncharacterized protein LOC112554335 [Pomacea canaliculata]
MAAIIVVGCTLLTAGMCAIVAPKHISVCRFDPLTNITDNIVYVTNYYLKNKTVIDIFDIFVYATALPGIFLSVIIVTTVITSIKLRAALAWRQSTVFKTTTAASSTSSDGDLKMTHKEASVTRMLMATSVLFIVCITPNLLLQVTTLVVPDFSQTGLYQHLISSCWRIVYCFWMMNSSCPFFVYFKMGSKFRGMVELKNGSKLYVIYNNFVVKGEDSLYQFHFDSLNSVLNPTGDCLSDLRGANFSTYDNDNDGDSSVNCASRHSGGGGGTI